MKLMRLRRLDKNGERCYGQMETDGGRIVCAATLEHPEVDADGNGLTDPNVSCIPAGIYDMYLRKSHKHGGDGGRDYDVWELIGVPGRKNVQVHIGNILAHTRGCILVGSRRSEQTDMPRIIGSSPAHDRWMEALAGETRARLEVLDPI